MLFVTPFVLPALISCAPSLSRLSLPLAQTPGQGTMLEAPVFEVGQRWEYQRVDLWTKRVRECFSQEILAREGANWHLRWSIPVSDDIARNGSVSSEWMAVDSHGFSDARREGAHLPLSFPLHQGKHWAFRYVYHAPSGTLVEVHQEADVQGWERVSVPAGEFVAIKVAHHGHYRATRPPATWSGRIEENYWYSPELRRVVKFEYRDTKGDGTPWDQWRDELVDYRSATAAQKYEP